MLLVHTREKKESKQGGERGSKRKRGSEKCSNEEGRRGVMVESFLIVEKFFSHV